ncbi:long-chain-fatty-acid--CoA ligase [Bradyrhizobium brasilense]|uniref:long-chain-fatty-acid--CoA ligase n=1 Tax=Bradyrhizobium brasilense TaxID=1419277 RepID=UPI0024B06FFE|nr:long-chain-fatty-acid--CoA ligase [Bradyrhizobium australafricanum]WFU31414.1 long-chain-fatty-acid--CoA ligase [Bradyrhizobium australafricanum]
METTMMDVPLSINHLLERAGKLFSTNEIISRLPDRSLRRHSYGEFYRRTRSLASALRQLGLKKGECVATLCWNHHAHLECYFGIPAAGGVMHTLNLRLPPDEIGWIAGNARDRFLIVDDILLPLYEQFAHLRRFERVIVFPFSGTQVPPDMEDYETLLARGDPGGFEYVPHEETDPVAMCYTSGTTGRPKGVVYSHRSTILHTLSASLAEFWALRSTDVVLPATPMFHVNAWGIPYGAVNLGAKLVFPGPHLHADDLLDLMQVEPPTLAVGVPTIWMTLMQTFEASQAEGSPNRGRWKLPKAMHGITGGAAVPESLIRDFSKHGVWLEQGWGMTETSPVCTRSYRRVELRDADENEQYRRATMAGVPLPLVDLRLWGDEGERPWDGRSVGEIQVRGPFITGSYHDVPVTRDKFTEDGWLRTGDVASVDHLGFVRIADRTKDLIKSGGEWISSADLESALMEHPAIAEAAVIAIPDEKWSERPLACVVLRPGGQFETRELNEHLLTKSFAKWQLPERYEVVDSIPRNSTGKFWKLKLRELFPR